MATQTFETRLKLKYGTWAEWNAAGAVVLLKGELGICEVQANHDTGNGGINSNRPVIMFKVGDGTSTFASLPWASATAADVYAWAKDDYATFTTKIKSTLGISSTVAADITAALANHYTKSEVDAKVATLNQAIQDEASARGEAISGLDAAYKAGDEAVLGKSTDESSANTVYGAKKGVEEAKAAAQAADTKAAQGVADAATAKAAADAAQDAAEAAQAAADKAQDEVDALETVVAGKADASALNDYYTKNTADGKFATIATVNGITAELAGLDDKFIDTTELASAKSELTTEIGKKVDQTAYNTKVGALEDEDERLAGLIGTNTSDINALKGASATHATKDELDAAKAALVGAANDASSADTIKGAKKYTDEAVANLLNNSTEAVDSIMELATAMENNADAIEALEEIAGSKASASDLTELKSRVDVIEPKAHTHTFAEEELNKIVEGDVKKWNDEVTAGTNHRADTDIHITAAERTKWDAVTDKAAQSDVTALTGRVSTAEEKITTLEGKMTTVEGAVATKAEAEVVEELSGTVSAMDAAYKAADTAINTELAKKATQSDLTALQTKVNGIDNHSHSNKTVLDGITADKVTNWDAAATDKHTHSNKAELDKIASGDKEKWDGYATSKADVTALQAAETRITALETMTLILDCGGPTTVTHEE